MSTEIIPPVALVKNKILSMHGHDRNDPYYWMNDPENPEVIQYLNEENAYYEASTRHLREFEKNLFEEMKSRIKEDDTSVPYLYNGYFYLTRFEKGKEYPIYVRKKGSLDAQDEIIFDGNKMAEGKKYFKLVGLGISLDNTRATFAIDEVGRRIYTIGVKDLVTGEILEDAIPNTTGNVVWGNDNKTIYYTTQDKKTLRADKVWKYEIGKPKSSQELYYEKDDTFSLSLMKSKSEKFILAMSTSTLTSEILLLDAGNSESTFKVFHPRERGLEYSIVHYDKSFYILTNEGGATNFKVMQTDESATEKSNWKEVIAHDENILLEGMDIFKDYLVVELKEDGLSKIQIRPFGGTPYYLPFESETYSAFVGTNVDYDTEILRYVYESMTTPYSVVDFNMRTKEKTVKKESEVLGGKFKKENYIEKRIWATAQDGTKIPISIVHHKDLKMNGKNPVLQYAYGSYGYSMEPGFDSALLSLLDRGFVYALAHIRGGEEMGRHWYENGKLLHKKNTFTDFIDCSKHLISENYTSPEHLYASGGSAGGLLMGAVANMSPELYNGIISSVPFMDVVTTMLDDSIPLTTSEYDEWGNPNELEYYNYMLSYSPYDNIKPQVYPNMLVISGLHDSQVQYWEPTKYVAKLRATKTDQNKLYLLTNMDAGHSGASGRFESLQELVKEYSFILDLEQIKK